MYKTFIREIRQHLANEPGRLNKINSYWNNGQKILPALFSDFFSDEIKSDSNESSVYALLAGYNYLMNRLGDKQLSDDAKKRLDAFEMEMKELVAPALVEEPCHSLTLESDKLSNRIRKQALLVDATNQLAHVASEFSKNTSRTFMVGKDMLMSRLACTCMLFEKNNSEIACGFSWDNNKNRYVMVVNAPYVGQISWHMAENDGLTKINQYLNGDIHTFLKKKNKDTDKDYHLYQFSGKVAKIDPRNNFAKLMNDVEIYPPDRVIEEPDRTLRRNLTFEKEGKFTKDGRKVYRLVVNEGKSR